MSTLRDGESDGPLGGGGGALGESDGPLGGSGGAALVRLASRLVGRDLELVRPLPGGIHATTLLVSDGARELVVRRFPPGDGAVHHEVGVLDRLEPLGERVPRLVASSTEQAMIVTTRVPGGAPAPHVPAGEIAAELARALVAIHSLDGRGLREEPALPPRGDGPVSRAARREWGGLELGDRVLTHYDYWRGNALWDGGVLTGVVDWSGARSAPRGVDLAWCRLDLVLLGSIEAADYFLAEYERRSGRVIGDARAWDLQAAGQADSAVESWAPGYAGIGRSDMTGPVLRERLDAWSALLLEPHGRATGSTG
ncbi:phosphotransferase family protein [Oerskovia jenensis]|uniref:phosphotransferase family protein n=1 Tax=Oerskovia jenensis TaxID=162169 RepID=UPI0036DBA60E